MSSNQHTVLLFDFPDGFLDLQSKVFRFIVRLVPKMRHSITAQRPMKYAGQARRRCLDIETQ